MQLSANAVSVQAILPWRDLFRAEMQCQIVHDSLHAREGWTQSYQLNVGPVAAGYGAIAIGGPWKGTRTVFEFYIIPDHRSRVFDLFAVFLEAAGATAFEVQTNDGLLTAMLHLWCRTATSEKIVFQDRLLTAFPANGVIFRRLTPADVAGNFAHHDEPPGDWLLEVDGAIAATGGILFHYNRPYGDIYMEVAAPFRRRGLGSYLVQELKRVCYEGGSVPCARCSPANLASLKTLQKAGFVPCAHILVGNLDAHDSPIKTRPVVTPGSQPL
jgi:GNAT superfamily N-acetyltransferase